ncbi:MAG: molybdopterin-dependent oxidoreductase [Candidatus Bathyarchaeia archaeon]
MEIIKSVCGQCHSHCGILVYVDQGRVVKIEGNPEDPINEGKLCPKGLATTKLLYHPDRLKFPLKRKGEKGEGRWERISWNEALDTIAEKFKEILEKYGPFAIAFGIGDGDRDNQACNLNLLTAMGSPNLLHFDAHWCLPPQFTAEKVTYGGHLTLDNYVDFKHSKCIMIWGANTFNTAPAKGRHILNALKNGAKLIVVDPRFTNLAAKADIWLQVRPASDCALALGMINVIINEGLYNREFVERWCYGFNELRRHVQKYTPQRVEEITWVPKEKIIEAARTYATIKPASLHTFLGVMMHPNAFQTLRAITMLPALTGNVDIPGGNILTPKGVWLGDGYRMFDLMVPHLGREVIMQRPGAKKFPLECGPEAFEYGFGYGGEAHSPTAFNEYIGDKIKAMWVCDDPVNSYEDVKQTIDKLKQLEFFVVIDFFMTPTASLADIVLPAAHWLERDIIRVMYLPQGLVVRAAPRVVAPLGECKDERWIAGEIIKRMGLKPIIPIDVKEYNDWRLKRLGITWDELKQKYCFIMPHQYKRYEKEGFDTPTGKIELYSTFLEKLGYEPLPEHKEPPESPYATPELAKEYPYILVSSNKPIVFYLPAHRQIGHLREICPDPIVEIHPETAAEHGIKDGDWVWIETAMKKGEKVKLKAKLTLGVHPKVVSAQAFWWFPERREDIISSCLESNINVLYSRKGPYDPVTGATLINGALCRIKKVG